MRKVVSLSIDDELLKRLESGAKSHQLSLSAYIRQLSLGVIDEGKDTDSVQRLVERVLVSEEEINIVGLAVLTHKSKVLIVKRSQQDTAVPNLYWAFPGGSLTTLRVVSEFRDILARLIGHSPAGLRPISARIIPDVVEGNLPVLALYYQSELSTEEVALFDKYIEYKWIKPTDIYKYFTTSVSDEVDTYLRSLG